MRSNGDLALPTLQRLRDQQPVRDVAFADREVVDVALKLTPFAWSADPTRLTRVSIVGCGAAYIANYWIERWARLPVEINVASEYRYRGARRGVIALDYARRVSSNTAQRTSIRFGSYTWNMQVEPLP
jgi:hypothetical protein